MLYRLTTRAALLSGLTLGALLAACTSGQQEAKNTSNAEPADAPPNVHAESLGAPPAEAPPAEAPPTQTVAFHDMVPGEKLRHMKTVVMPAMAKAFKEYDPKEFAEFGCTTCHGQGVQEGKFEMPNPALPPLSKKLMDAHPAMTKFMSERVVPEMAQLLGEAPYDPAKGEGFGCLDCHTEKK